MIYFPETVDELARLSGEIRAGGTALHDRRRLGLSHGPLIDLRNIVALENLNLSKPSIGAMVTLEHLGEHPWIQKNYAALAEAIAHIATPQIRRVATVGGNLLQRNRCWYYREKDLECYKKGGDHCSARREGQVYDVCWDLGPCITPHPSTLGVVFLAYDAVVQTLKSPGLSIEQLFGDGRSASCDHYLPASDILCAVELPPPVPEVSGYRRVSDRTFAAWPLIEMVVRLQGEQYISHAHIAVGGIASVPVRLAWVEDFLTGQPLEQMVFSRAADLAADPIVATELVASSKYKLVLLKNCLQALLQTCAHSLQRSC
ncbi:FAD binding domain-containing protein [Ktedonobacter robiniae]|uniref:Oxidoreductase n=1 Tax=Ktedonobacter robiniae TaxID=2778365 RepID=A0ABQ3V4R3_9CHLR|nr:FAD binding domain-containing protein [Ktedonobacter robiniae]GHO59993.1 oxidoreductase [Ktedonobacter robiniae]